MIESPGSQEVALAVLDRNAAVCVPEMTNRRQFLASVAPCGLLLLSSLGARGQDRRAALASTMREECRRAQHRGEPCTVSVGDVRPQKVRSREQVSNWSWAVCVSMVFAHYGHVTSPKRIVNQAYHSITNIPRSLISVAATLNREWIDDAGAPFTSTADWTPSTAHAVIQDIVSGFPLLIEVRGRAAVVVKLSFFAPFSGPQVIEAVVADPSPYTPLRHTLSAKEWQRVQLVMQIRVP